MSTSSSTAFDWMSIVDYELIDPDRLKVGTITGIYHGDDPAEVLALVVPGDALDHEILLPVSMIGIVGARWVMLDQSVAKIRSSIRDDSATAA